MKIYSTTKVEQPILTDITCDLCGKSCRDKLDMNLEYSQWNAEWGYGSNRDCERWSCELCEECSVKVKEFIESQGGKVTVTQILTHLFQ